MQGLSLGSAGASYTPNFIYGDTDDHAEAYTTAVLLIAKTVSMIKQ